MQSPGDTRLPENETLVDIDDAKPLRSGWWLMLLGFGGFILWGALAPLDKGITASGTVVVSGNHKAVQSLNPGIIKAIYVKDGDWVAAEQILIELDATQAQSQLDVSNAQLHVTLAVEARLLAERDGKSDISFPQALLDATDEGPRVAEAVALQRRLIRTRRLALRNDIATMRENIAGLKAQASSLEGVLRAKKEQIRLLQEELAGLRELTKEGFLPRNRLSEQERLLSQLLETLSQDIGHLAQARSSINEMNLRILTRQDEYQREVETLLTDTAKEVTSLQSHIMALEFDLLNTKIKASTEGIIVGLSVNTIGGVVQSGLRLMDIVPMNESLKIDVKIAPNLIDKVKAGLPAEIRFTALSQTTTPQIPGQIVKVSVDVLVDELSKEPFYKVLVQVTPEGMHKLKYYEIRPGMPVDVFFSTGERTMLSYLFKPITDRMHGAMVEE